MSPQPTAAAAGERTWFVHSFGSQDWLLMGYFGALLVALAFGKGYDRSACMVRVSADLGVYLFVVALVRLHVLRWGSAVAALLYRAAIMCTLLASFFQLREILPAVSPWSDDARIYEFDLRVFGFEPSVWLDRFVSPATTEWFAFFYFFYFLVLTLHVLPMLFSDGDDQVLARFAVGILLVFVPAHLLYMIVPGWGPYWYLKGTFQHELQGGTFWRLVRETVDAGGAQKDIFPSLHTAVPTFLAIFSFRHRRLSPFKYSWPVVALFATQIIIATLFLRWHYLIDVVAGLTLAATASLVGHRIADWERVRRERLGVQPAWMPLVYPWNRTPDDERMLGFEIIGTGHYVPGRPVTNADLSRVMDTNDDWIFKRSGIRQRHYAPEGVGASDLALHAAKRAIEAARIQPNEIDYLVFATMTPDHIFPGSGALLAHKLGLRGVPALDIRQQCAAMLFALQLVNGLVQSRAAKTILVVGAEAHAGFMPWDDWDALDPANGSEASLEAKARTNKHRALAVLFGDGAGALVFRATERDAGLRGLKLHTDGGAAKLLYVEGGGFRTRPYWKHDDFGEQKYIPTMDGRELFKFAVTKLPESLRALSVETGTPLDKIDWFLAHQANARINDYVRAQLGVPAHKLPSNIDRFGNTSAATLPILIDEQTRAGKLKHGDLCMLLALGAGVHWGCALVRW